MSVLVFADSNNGTIAKSAQEAIHYGSKIGETTVITYGDVDDSVLAALGSYGASKVLINKTITEFDGQKLSKLVRAAAESAEVIVFAMDFSGKSISSRVAAGLNAGMVSGALSLPDTSNGFIIKKAVFSGKAFANSPVAAVHALAYPIGGTFHVSHGLSNSLVLPYVLRFNSADNKTTKDYAELAPFIFPEINTDQGNQAVCKEFIDQLELLSKKIGLPQKLREVNIPKDACKKMASDAMKQSRLLVNNPREVTENDALNIYEAAW